MWKWGTTAGLRALSVFYLLSASAFGFAIALQAQQPWALGTRKVAQATGPFLVSTAYVVNEQGLKPAWAFTLRSAHEAGVQITAWISPKQTRPAPVPVAKLEAKKPIASHSAIKPVLPAVPPVAKTVPAAKAPEMQLAQQQPETLELMPAPDSAPPAPGEVSRVLSHLKISLTRELYENFALFLYVSKADHGPWQQRMFVFAKQENGDLKLKYSFPVSTGREVLAPGPKGNLLRTNTPPGIYQLDSERMYKRYTSGEWQHKMPYAMFFNWEHDGLQTGLAIHSAVGADVDQLGKRASAGCVRLHPQNAELLFRLIKANYRGLTPRFAYDNRTATMSNEGLLMHDKAGNIQYQDGYKVLVLIENNGGDDVIAALF